MANYGDVALGLPANWNRNTYDNQADWVLYTVGHAEGKADAYLEDEPDKRHQFRWVDPRDPNEVTKAQMQHYVFVKKGEWVKHEILWGWDAEGFCVFAGQRLMARPEELFVKDNEKRERNQNVIRGTFDREMENAPSGLIAEAATTGKKRKKGI